MKRQNTERRFFSIRSTAGLLVVFVLLYAGLNLFVYAVSDRIIFRPHPPHYERSDDLIWLKSANGKAIAARWYESPQAKYTLLFSHGNYGDLGDIDYDVQRLRDLGVSVFAYDYQGYGISEGEATVANACQDAEAALCYLVEEKGIPLNRIILHGRSVGGGPTLYLARRHAAAGIILESTFTSAFRVVTRVPVLPVDKFRNLRAIRTLQSPVLVIHGAADRKIPIYHGKALYQNAPERKQCCWLADSNHDVMTKADRQKYEDAIAGFLKTLSSSD